MIKIKDTNELEMDEILQENKLKKVGSNYLFFKRRARSRSFIKFSGLSLDDHDDEDSHNDTEFGVSGEGKKFHYSPKDSQINNKYAEVKVLAQEILSPSIVTLVKSDVDGKVSQLRDLCYINNL